MNLHSFILVAGILSRLPLEAGAAADIDLKYFHLTGGYAVSTTPTKIGIQTDHTQAVVSTRSIIYTLDTALFSTSASGQSATCTGTTGTTVGLTCLVNAAGTVLTATVTSGTIAATDTFMLEVTAPIAQLPSAEGAVTVSSITANSGADTLNGGSVSLFSLVSAPTAVLTSTNMVVGTQPTQLVVTFKTPIVFLASRISAPSPAPLQLIANKNIFKVASVSTGLTSTGATFANIYGGSSATTFDASFDSATHTTDIAIGTTIVMTLASNLFATLPNDAGAVLLSIYWDGDDIFAGITGFGTIVASGGAGAVGADPVANLGNVRRAFELPLHTLTPLMKSPDLVIHGSVFPGDETEQWFDRVVITTPDESRWMEVKVKKDLEHVNISRVPAWELATLDVSLGYGSIAEPVTQTKLHILDQKIPYSFLDQDIVFRKMHRLSNLRFPVVGGIRRECLDMAGTSLHLFLCSAPAHEYYGPLHHLSLRYMHLDLAFIEVRDYNELTGLLPELWGKQPMTEATQAYVKEEKKETPNEEFQKQEAQQTGENSTAWVGGIGMEEVREGCFEQHEPFVATV